VSEVESARPSLEIPGVYQGLPSGLIFEILEIEQAETSFRCTFYKGEFQGSVQLATDNGAAPSVLFAEMALEWRGWAGIKVWEDIEKVLTLRASSDRCGHITLRVEMRPNGSPYRSETVLASALMLDAGSLDKTARAVAQLFKDETALAIVNGLSGGAR
jgi:uncharacterized protein DUF6228